MPAARSPAGLGIVAAGGAPVAGRGTAGRRGGGGRRGGRGRRRGGGAGQGGGHPRGHQRVIEVVAAPAALELGQQGRAVVGQQARLVLGDTDRRGQRPLVSGQAVVQVPGPAGDREPVEPGGAQVGQVVRLVAVTGRRARRRGQQHDGVVNGGQLAGAGGQDVDGLVMRAGRVEAADAAGDRGERAGHRPGDRAGRDLAGRGQQLGRLQEVIEPVGGRQHLGAQPQERARGDGRVQPAAEVGGQAGPGRTRASPARRGGPRPRSGRGRRGGRRHCRSSGRPQSGQLMPPAHRRSSPPPGSRRCPA